MADNDWKKRLGVVFSTNPDYAYSTDETDEKVSTPEPDRQHLVVRIDRHGRSGKQVTLVQGFVGDQESLSELARNLKVKLGTGGCAKDGEIVIQGDWRDRVCELLIKSGYHAKRGN